MLPERGKGLAPLLDVSSILSLFFSLFLFCGFVLVFFLIWEGEREGGEKAPLWERGPNAPRSSCPATRFKGWNAEAKQCFSGC